MHVLTAIRRFAPALALFSCFIPLVNAAAQPAAPAGLKARLKAPSAASGETAVAVAVNTLKNRHAISPYIYGANFPPSASYIAKGGVTLSRWGGNNSSRYNWLLNVTNLDNDWYFENYAWGAGGLATDSSHFISNVVAAGGSPIMTIPMLPWVAKDGHSNSFSVAKYGPQCSTDYWRPDAGDGILTNCSADLTGNDPNDAHVPLIDLPGSRDPAGSVYRKPWIEAIAPKFGSRRHFYDLDNEPDIWSGTHRDVHPSPTGYDELAAAIVKEGHAIKAYDPEAVRLGPVFCCWWYYWNGANNNDKAAHGGLDFLPWLLNEVLFNDVVAGSRSLDVFDVHAYFNGPSTWGLTLAQTRVAALRETRDWWDPTYVSESGTVTQQWTTSIQPDYKYAFVIPRMRAMANSIYPGTPASFYGVEWRAGRRGAIFPRRWWMPTPTAFWAGSGCGAPRAGLRQSKPIPLFSLSSFIAMRTASIRASKRSLFRRFTTPILTCSAPTPPLTRPGQR